MVGVREKRRRKQRRGEERRVKERIEEGRGGRGGGGGRNNRDTLSPKCNLHMAPRAAEQEPDRWGVGRGDKGRMKVCAGLILYTNTKTAQNPCPHL